MKDIDIDNKGETTYLIKYKFLDRPIKEIPTEELKVLFPPSTTNSFLMRSIILNEKQYMTCNYTRTLRSLWYSTVKPTLDRLGLLSTQDMTEDSLTAWDKTLSKYLAELVRDGLLSYRDLNIEDESRRKQVPQYYNTFYSNVILAVEKDTVFNIVKDIADLFGCSCISSKGLCSLGATEYLLRQVKESKPNEEIHFLTLTDYDPTGYSISDTFKQQAEDLRQVLDLKCNIHVERIGITPEQLTQEELELNQYTPKAKGIEKWLALTGGINGQSKGLELDAFTPDRMREIFATCLQNYIDQNVYTETIKQDFIQSKVRESLNPYIDAIVKDMTSNKFQDVKLLDYDIFQFAKDGYSYIPTHSICQLDNDNLTELAQQYFKI